MSTSAIVPISSIDFGSSSATASQQSVFDSLLSQLQQSIGTGNLTTSQTLLNAIDALSPSSASGSNPLGTFLTNLGTALNDGSVSEAQSALATYQSNSTTATTPAAPAENTSATAAAIAANLVQSQIQLSLVTTLLGPNSSFGSNVGNTSSTPSDSSANSLIGILNAAYSTGNSPSNSASSSSSASTPSVPSATPSTTPYDTLVSSIQASLASGHGALTPALAYLQATGNFVNTSA
jgi:hypothetical protein